MGTIPTFKHGAKGTEPNSLTAVPCHKSLSLIFLAFCFQGRILLQYGGFINRPHEWAYVSRISQDCEVAQCSGSHPVPPVTKVPSHQGHRTQWRFGSWTQVGSLPKLPIASIGLTFLRRLDIPPPLLDSVAPAAAKARGCAT